MWRKRLPHQTTSVTCSRLRCRTRRPHENLHWLLQKYQKIVEPSSTQLPLFCTPNDSFKNDTLVRQSTKQARQEYNNHTARVQQEYDEGTTRVRREHDESTTRVRREYDESMTRVRREYDESTSRSRSRSRSSVIAKNQAEEQSNSNRNKNQANERHQTNGMDGHMKP